ncbi:MAG: GAF domain-containing protein [Chloroflexota bacterium]
MSSKRAQAQLLNEMAGLRRQIRALKEVEENQGKLLAELESIHLASWRMQHSPTSENVAQELISVLEQKMGYEYGAVLLVDPTGNLIPYALSQQGQDESFVERDKTYVQSHKITTDKGLTGWVARTGQSICLGDVREDSRYYSMREDIRSELCVPLCIHDQVIGVLNVETTISNAYRYRDQRLLETVAAQLATILENLRLRSLVQQQKIDLEPQLPNTDDRQHILNMCASCKRIRDNKQQWLPVEVYFHEYSNIEFSHGICPHCMKALYPEYYNSDT